MNEDMRQDLKSGMIVKVHQKIKDVNKKGEERERIQIFEGMVLAVKHGKEAGATFTVRKVSEGIGVEKIFPINSPVVAKVELVRQMKVSQARPYYLRDYRKKLQEVKSGAKMENPIKKATKAEEKKKEGAEEAVMEEVKAE